MATLDRSRDFGEIMGDSEGRRYCQDGLYFDANGNQIGGEKPAPQVARPKRTASKPVPQTVTDDQLLAQLGE